MKTLSSAAFPLMLLLACNVFAGPQVLSDEQMDDITAGTTGHYDNPAEATTGGTLTADQSSTTLANEALVNLSENSQIDARAISLVSAADGLSANAVNLWNGATSNLNSDSSINVVQSNDLTQVVSSKYAHLFDYRRKHGTVRDVHTWADSTAPVQNIEFGLQIDVPGVGSLDGRAEVPAAVIPGAKIPGSFGNVVGFAGEIGIEYDGGWFEAGFDLASSLTAAAHLDTASSSSLAWGWIDLGSSSIHSDTTVSASFNPYITLEWELPDFSLNGEGAVCFANGGECRSGILDRDVADLWIDSARAEHIVVDRSELNASSTFGVDLGAEAQANARAIHLVNLAGGLVANGANIATASDTGGVLSTDQLILEQDNTVTQAIQPLDDHRRPNGERRRDRSPVPGGVIVANESAAVLTRDRFVHAAGGAQAGARAVSLVNAADALVATGVNIWDGRVQENTIGDRTDVWQTNELMQSETSSAATLSGYKRDGESLYIAETYAKSTATPKYLGTTFDLDIVNPETGDPIATATGKLEIPASIIPTSKIPGIGGTAAAFAGDVELHIDGGSAEFGFGIEESGLHFATNNNVSGGTSASLGLIEFDGEGHLNYSADATIDASLNLTVDMPDLDLSLDGAACFAQKGSCEATVTDRETGDLEVEKAVADYIVVDRSELSVSTSDSVILESGAQSGARAVSLVNAGGGWVAAGVNIASWRGDESLLAMPTLNVKQGNLVTQHPEWGANTVAMGGIIAGSESTATLTDAASVEIMGGAQSDVRALSVVNSAGAQVGTGLNVWAGNLAQAAFDNSVNVDQSNVVIQQSVPSTASLRSYDRDAGSLRHVYTSATTKPGSPPDDGFFPPGTPGQIYGESSLEIGDIVTLDRTGHVPTNIIPTSKIPGGKPGALAIAGQGSLHYDGGSVDLESSTGAGFMSTTDAGATGNASAFFGILNGSANNSYVEHIGSSLTTDLVIEVDLPDLTIEVDGAACISKGADCSAGIIEREIAALHIARAAAENIVVDRSQLTIVEDFSVVLGESAQADARALLLVNGAGGDVANALNIARVVASDLAAQPNIAQSNIVVQGAAPVAGAESEPSMTRATGGTFVANESMATMSSSARVELGPSAQNGVHAVAIVNAADALVANGINIWDGDLGQAQFNNSVNIQQTNQVFQYTAPTAARVSGYHRDDYDSREVSTVANSQAEQQFIKVAFDIDLGDLGSYSEGLAAPAAAIPNSKIPGAKGVVAGFAGEADVSYGGGDAYFELGIDGHYGYDNLVSTDAAVEDFLGFGTSSGSIEFGVDDFSIDFAPTLTFAAEFSTLDIKAEGALCWANGGTCFASIRKEQNGDICIDDAQAEHIVVDHATLDATESYSVSLGASAQANARAMAIVNAAGGLVSNSINVSNFSGATLNSPTINLVQRNVVIQGN